MHDLVIRNGTLIDGTGAPAFTGDLAITDGCIAQVGGKAGAAKREINADGALVTPGFVDIHTHYDGQVTWDPYLSPSSSHGVTSVVFGNCGVGFAPAKPEKRGWLIGLMEGVEDIPGAALAEGIRWDWKSFPQYLDALDKTKLAIDVGAQMPHGPLRAYVMGERAHAIDKPHEEATPDEIAQMYALTKEALEAGALGFSTSRVLIHKSKAGELVPGTFASRDELFGIGKALKDVGHGVFQMTSIHDKLESEYAWIKDLAREVGCPVQFNFQQGDREPHQWKDILTMIEGAHAEGLRITAGMAGRPVGLLFSLQASLHPLVAYPVFHEVAALPPAERLARLRDPAFRARLLACPPRDLGEFINYLVRAYQKMFPMVTEMDYEPPPEKSIAAIAQATGQAPLEILLDAMLANDGKGFVYFPIFNYSYGNIDHLATQMRSPATVLSLSDGGAHCSVICDGSLPTFMLTHWARDRSRGPRLPLEFIVQRQTRDTARFYGLNDRGVLKEGYKADVNIIDYAKLGLSMPEMIYDLPANGKRLMQTSTGYVATIVSGVPIFEGGVATGGMPGRLVRGVR